MCLLPMLLLLHQTALSLLTCKHFAFADLPNTTNLGQGHAKQDLSEKLDDAAPGLLSALAAN